MVTLLFARNCFELLYVGLGDGCQGIDFSPTRANKYNDSIYLKPIAGGVVVAWGRMQYRYVLYKHNNYVIHQP